MIHIHDHIQEDQSDTLLLARKLELKVSYRCEGQPHVTTSCVLLCCGRSRQSQSGVEQENVIHFENSYVFASSFNMKMPSFSD